MTRTKTVLRALLGVGAAGAIAAFGTFSAFSSTTDNPGNTIATGSVAISDNDGGSSKMFTLTGAKPEADYDRCIAVTYTGTLPANVRMTMPTAPGVLASDLDLDVTAGTQAPRVGREFGECDLFTPAAGPDLYGTDLSHTLAKFADFADWDSGLQHNPGTAWEQGETVVYRFRVKVQDDAPQGVATNAFTVKWEARNQ